MKKEIAKIWCEALRSGKYKQGKHYLHKKYSNENEFFCCLGVLCDIAKNHIKLDIGKAGSNYIIYDGESSSLPKSVMEWSEIKSDLGECINPITSLVHMNDLMYESFDKIADFIESNYKKL